MSRFNASSRVRSLEDEHSSSTRINSMDYQSFSETVTAPTARQGLMGALDGSGDATTDRTVLDRDPTESGDPIVSTSVQYRGFATSINDMFVDSQYERSDCCAITCCGILQHDRDRFLLTGIKPPSLLKRFLVHVVIPLTIFFAAGIGAVRIQDVVANEIISTLLLLLFLFYILLQCSKGRAKRIDIRKDLLFTKYQIKQHHVLSATNPEEPRRGQYQTLAVLLEHERPTDGRDNSERIYYLGQTRRDLGCAHPCCTLGCYAEDRPKNITRIGNDDNICSCMFDYVCPPYCGSYIQCCGMCAIAQEARDIETCILPAPYRRIDYISTYRLLVAFLLLYILALTPCRFFLLLSSHGSHSSILSGHLPAPSSAWSDKCAR
jgi:hypothetical protein